MGIRGWESRDPKPHHSNIIICVASQCCPWSSQIVLGPELRALHTVRSVFYLASYLLASKMSLIIVTKYFGTSYAARKA